MFLASTRSQHEASWGGFWGRLGASWPLLGPSWAPWARLGGVLGASWGLLKRHVKKMSKTSSKRSPKKNPPAPGPDATCLSMGTGSAMNLKVISRSCSDHAPNILQTCFNQLTIDFRSIATLFRYVSYHISDEFPRCHKQVYLRKAHKH